MNLLNSISTSSLGITMIGTILILAGLMMETKKGYGKGLYESIEVIGIFLIEIELFHLIGFMDWWPLMI